MQITRTVSFNDKNLLRWTKASVFLLLPSGKARTQKYEWKGALKFNSEVLLCITPGAFRQEFLYYLFFTYLAIVLATKQN